MMDAIAYTLAAFLNLKDQFSDILQSQTADLLTLFVVGFSAQWR